MTSETIISIFLGIGLAASVGFRVFLPLFALSLAGLYLGHHGNGGLKAVFRDIQLMMIAPVWLLSNLYKRFGISY